MLLKGIAPDRMKTINKLTHLSKTCTASKVKVVNLFFELLAEEQEEEMRNLTRLHPQENRNSPVQYELVLRCAGEPDPDKKYLLGKALLCLVFSLKLLIKKMGATARYRVLSIAKTNLWGSTNRTALRPKLECSLVG
jgi:hypothetical protein